MTRQGASSEAQFLRTTGWTVSLPRIKAREGIANVIIQIFYYRDEVVKGWRNRRNINSIIESRVVSKDLSEEFSFRERRDRCRVVRSNEVNGKR